MMQTTSVELVEAKTNLAVTAAKLKEVQGGIVVRDAEIKKYKVRNALAL